MTVICLHKKSEITVENAYEMIITRLFIRGYTNVFIAPTLCFMLLVWSTNLQQGWKKPNPPGFLGGFYGFFMGFFCFFGGVFHFLLNFVQDFIVFWEIFYFIL